MKELSEVLQDWEAVIGLEIHTELTALDTKMFCNCKLSHDDEPNANVCPVCLGLPGALPVPNKRAIESIVKAGLATNCEIQRHSMFYRKHYFYPDMAKNFQTTQGPVAFAMYGHLDLDVTGRGAAERPDCAFGEAEAQSLASASANAEGLSTSMTSTMREGNQRAGHLASYDASNLQMPERREDGSYTVPIRILRIHMEEDAAKMVHVGGAEGRITAAAESLVESSIAPAQVAALAKLLATDAISSNQAHEVFEAMAQTGDDPNKIVDERGMRQVSDAGALQPIVDEVLANCAEQAQQYRDGNQKVIGFLVGQCMKASRGKGNPKLFNELLRTSLS